MIRSDDQDATYKFFLQGSQARRACLPRHCGPLTNVVEREAFLSGWDDEDRQWHRLQWSIAADDIGQRLA